MWARAVPYDEFARLRREAPVAWSPGEGGFWSVTRYADIVTASRDVATFSSGRGVSFEDPTDEDMAARRTIIRGRTRRIRPRPAGCGGSRTGTSW